MSKKKPKPKFPVSVFISFDDNGGGPYLVARDTAQNSVEELGSSKIVCEYKLVRRLRVSSIIDVKVLMEEVG